MTERRRTIRLPHYDYSSPGAYFVTICAHDGRFVFGEPEVCSLVEEVWNQIPRHFPNAATDEFVVMPNHVHGIVWVLEGHGVADQPSRVRPREVGAQHAAPLRYGARRTSRRAVQPGSLGAIVRSFKAAAARRINLARGTPGLPVWQRNYYERVVRNEGELRRIREYIQLNPVKWQFDRENARRVPDAAYDRQWGWLEGSVGTVVEAEP